FNTNACDDGNPCTTDTCTSTAGCSHQALPDGTTCSDGNLCTVGDVCRTGACSAQPKSCDDGALCTVDVCQPSTGQCSHGPVPCDDGDACTVDSCLGTTGQCAHVPVAFGQPTLQVGPVAVSWNSPIGGTWNTYRGTIPAGLMGNRRQPYDHECVETLDFLEDGPARTLDPGLPAPGTAFYYLVTERNACGEGSPGSASNGVPRPNASPCVTGP
ncbi:MAG TPA: hypothetical protein VFQ07_14225, partial [Candidatus Polarisedimenticolia bacterium]|nr:hypothetical protein [Candidatus Polarisedimenticolia bacterium]